MAPDWLGESLCYQYQEIVVFNLGVSFPFFTKEKKIQNDKRIVRNLGYNQPVLQHENEAKLLHLLPVISILFCHPIVRKCLILVSNVSEYLFMIFNRLSPAFLYPYCKWKPYFESPTIHYCGADTAQVGVFRAALHVQILIILCF